MRWKRIQKHNPIIKWIDVEGYPEYGVSQTGVVRRKRIILIPKVNKRYKTRAKWLVPTVLRGVAMVRLMNDDRTRSWFQLKDIVANHWLPDRTDKMIDLIDKSDPTNCRVENLKEIKRKPRGKPFTGTPYFAT